MGWLDGGSVASGGESVLRDVDGLVGRRPFGVILRADGSRRPRGAGQECPRNPSAGTIRAGRPNRGRKCVINPRFSDAMRAVRHSLLSLAYSCSPRGLVYPQHPFLRAIAMPTLTVTCDRCGTSLEVPEETGFLTCTVCSSELAVHRHSNTAYTEVLRVTKGVLKQQADLVATALDPR